MKENSNQPGQLCCHFIRVLKCQCHSTLTSSSTSSLRSVTRFDITKTAYDEKLLFITFTKDLNLWHSLYIYTYLFLIPFPYGSFWSHNKTWSIVIMLLAVWRDTTLKHDDTSWASNPRLCGALPWIPRLFGVSVALIHNQHSALQWCHEPVIWK